jgi:hypothetical protein
MRRLTALVAAIALAAVLASCAPVPEALSRQASTDLQAGVVAVAESAASGDQAAALARLDALQQALADAVAAGDVTAERAASIQSAIDLVRADLQPAPAPSVEPTPQPTADPTVTDNGDDNSGPGNNNGNDDKGKGNGKGKDD